MASEDHLPTVAEAYDTAPCGLLLLSRDGTILRANETFCRWAGYATHDVVGKVRLQDMLSVGARVFHQTHWAPLMDLQGSVAEVKMDLRKRDGSRVPMLFNSVRREFNGRQYDEVSVVVVTDRQKYERELLAARNNAEYSRVLLELADKRKNEFMATLAHELRNPLAPMRNAVYVLQLETEASPRVVSATAILNRQLEQMTRLVSDLLEGALISENKLTLRLETINVMSAVRLAIEAASPLIVTAGHHFSLIDSDDVLEVSADTGRLAQLVQNLINNAVKYTPQGGTITLAVGKDGSNVTISVRDSGIGLETSQLERIFGMFEQVEPAPGTIGAGLGIGLALSQKLAHMHGGTLVAKSEGLGLGCEFLLSIPRVQQ